MISVTLADVAKKADVSIMTASKVMNGVVTVRDYLRQRVLEAARQLNYHPNLHARSMAGSERNIITCSVTDIMNPFFGNMTHLLQVNLSSRGYHPIIVSNSQDLFEVTRGYKAAGTVMMYSGFDFIREIVRSVPVVTIGGGDPKTQGASDVMVDLPAAYRAMTRRVIAHGRRRIAWYCSPPAYANNRAAKFSLVESVLARQHLTAFELPMAVMGRQTDLANYLVKQSLPVDAIFCQNDLEAVSVVVALQRAGIRCPEDILVIGCDGNFLIEGLWSISIDLSAMVTTAVELLIKQIAGEPANPQRVILKAELMTGNTA